MRTIKRIILVSIITFSCLIAIKRINHPDNKNDNTILTQADFDDLPNWQQDTHQDALEAFKLSCQQILFRKPDQPFSAALISGGLTRDWQAICREANKLDRPDSQTARLFFEKWFNPFYVRNEHEKQGHFTGYYLPLLHASLARDHHYKVPIYALPADLIKVNLGEFNSELAGKTIAGRLQQQKLVLYPDRAEINKGAIDKTAPVIAWADSETDLFFAQIQGSAIVELPDRQRFLIGYSGANGRRYTAIGSILISKFGVPKNEISMQRIRAWLQEHPDQAGDLLNQNASYVFFQKLPTESPLGVFSSPLTPERSLAIDMRYMPLGAPVWLDTKIPKQDQAGSVLAYRRLLITQDTGSAIKGRVRGDIYFGPGSSAEFLAGHMNQAGQYWILLPKQITYQN